MPASLGFVLELVPASLFEELVPASFFEELLELALVALEPELVELVPESVVVVVELELQPMANAEATATTVPAANIDRVKRAVLESVLICMCPFKKSVAMNYESVSVAWSFRKAKKAAISGMEHALPTCRSPRW